jgi:hypothetical protein
MMTANDVRDLLRTACDGNQRRWAAANSISAPYVSDVLAGKREPGETILRALGLDRKTVYFVNENNCIDKEPKVTSEDRAA